MASVEFAFIVPIIILIVLGTYDIGNYVLQEMKLTEAAQAGGQYAVAYPSDNAGTTCAVQLVLCPNVTTGRCPGAASCPLPAITISGPSTSGSGANTETTVTITLTQAYTPVLLINVLTSLTASDVVRVQ
jgi:hypothetical protein